MNAALLFLLACGAGLVGLGITAGAQTVMQEIEGFVALLGFAVLIGACGVTAEVGALRSDLRKREKEEKEARP